MQFSRGSQLVWSQFQFFVWLKFFNLGYNYPKIPSPFFFPVAKNFLGVIEEDIWDNIFLCGPTIFSFCIPVVPMALFLHVAAPCAYARYQSRSWSEIMWMSNRKQSGDSLKRYGSRAKLSKYDTSLACEILLKFVKNEYTHLCVANFGHKSCVYPDIPHTRPMCKKASEWVCWDTCSCWLGPLLCTCKRLRFPLLSANALSLQGVDWDRPLISGLMQRPFKMIACH